ncbi:hypothetical protein MMC25_003269 [Agyrium rufum]|nr:hypothetical protein [Agyrium rufum]
MTKVVIAHEPGRQFTPEAFISSPRRSAATPNASGHYALYTVSTYSFESHSETKETRILDLESGQSFLFSDDAKNQSPQWLTTDQIFWTREGPSGTTEVWIGAVNTESKNAYLAATIPGPANDLKVKALDADTIALAFVAKYVPGSDEIFNPETAEKPKSSAREYDSILVRFWDSYWSAEISTVFYTTLKRDDKASRFQLSKSGYINALKTLEIDCPPYPADARSGAGFQIGLTGLLCQVRDPDTDARRDMKQVLYYVPLSTFTEAPAPEPLRLHCPGCEGSISEGVFSRDGKSIAFTAQKSLAYMDPGNIFVAPDVNNLNKVVQLTDSDETHQDSWLSVPGSLSWASNGKTLLISAEERGRIRLYQLAAQPPSKKGTFDQPSPLTHAEGTVSAFHPLTDSADETRILVSKTSMNESFVLSVVDYKNGEESLLVKSSQLKDAFALCQASEFTIKGSGGYDVQSWILKPSNFDKTRSYPVALLIHGGPASSWKDTWSTRWNYSALTEQGYVVLAPNPTGSTGWGTTFAKAVVGEWGGRTYVDIVDSFEHLKKTADYIDTDRVVALGASFGGYMMNWIAGQPLAKELKAIVCHDGIFNMASMLGGDVPSILGHDIGAQLWEDVSAWDKHDPSRYTHNWNTPTLVIHSDKDYRCQVTEGLAMMHVCQCKGIPSRYLNFPDENHFVLKHENSLRWHKSVLGWINKYAGVDDGQVLEPPVTEPKTRMRGTICS